MAKLTQGPDLNVKKPKLVAPHGACDAHIHLFGPAAKYPFASDSPYTAHDALPEDFFKLQETLGLATGVIVSPGGYGRNSAMLSDTLAKYPDRFRGIAQTNYTPAVQGGVDFAQSQFNRALQARRQPGSSFKPYVYSTALMNGFKPTSVLQDGPICIGNWCPHNYSGGYSGSMTLVEALRHGVGERHVGLVPDGRHHRHGGVEDRVRDRLRVERPQVFGAAAAAAQYDGAERQPRVPVQPVQLPDGERDVVRGAAVIQQLA
mgnify:CR=1 FL=1